MHGKEIIEDKINFLIERKVLLLVMMLMITAVTGQIL